MTSQTPPNLGSLSDNFATANATQIVEYAKDTCSLVPYFVATEPYSSGYTYHSILLIVSAIATIFCLVFTVWGIWRHFSAWVRPVEQRQIIRILLFPPIFALFNFFSLYSYKNSWILLPFPELYETFALVAMFHLIVVWVSPHDYKEREEYFRNLERLHGRGRGSEGEEGKVMHDRSSLGWFKKIWLQVHQILPLKLLTALLTWILSATTCPLKFHLSKSALAITIISSISASLSIYAIILFAQRMSPHLHALKMTTKCRQKLISFKGVVGITLVQTPLFTGLATSGRFRRTGQVSVLDFVVGTVAFLTCVEMGVLAGVFCWTFGAGEYVGIKKEGEGEGEEGEKLGWKGVGGALVDVLDVRDVGYGYWYMGRILWWYLWGEGEGEGEGEKNDVGKTARGVDVEEVGGDRRRS